MMRSWVGLVMAALVGAGCAGVGYSMGHTTLSVGPDTASSAQSLESTKSMALSTAYHQFRIVDTSGFLLSALVSSSRQAEARDQAIDEARAKGAKAGDVVEYAYEPLGIMPGLRVVADLRLGFGGPSATWSALPGYAPQLTSESGTYWGLDVSGEVFSVRPAPGFVATAGVSMLADNFELENMPAGLNVSEFGVDVYATGKAGYELTPNLGVVGSAHLGLVTPLMYALVGDENTPAFSAWSGVELAWRPLKQLSLTAELRYGRYLSGQRGIRQGSAQAGLLATF